MEESSQESTPTISLRNEFSLDDLVLSSQVVINEWEKDVQTLERDIRQQKESSINAKTAITFDQLRKIHSLGKVLGPQKEIFFDRICRAADIQRASLKNRLKQNKEKFEPNASSPSVRGCVALDSPSFNTDSPFSSQQTTQDNEILRGNMSIDSLPSTIPPIPPSDDDVIRISAERNMDLMNVGFSFEEVKQLNDLFEQYRKIVKTSSSSLQNGQIVSMFSNFISTNIPEPLRLISSAFNLLEMGYGRKDVYRTIQRERSKMMQEAEEVEDRPSPAKKPCPSPSLFFSPTDDKDGGETDTSS